MADIAKMAGVSASTVSRALAGSHLVEKTQRDRIVKIARDGGYVINSTARNLRLQRSETISVIIPLGHASTQPLSDPFFVEMLGYLAEEITRRGYGMFVQKISPPMDDWMHRLIGSHRSDGIIVIGQSTEHSVIEAAAMSYRPLVVWGGHDREQSYCTVGTDNVAGARAGVQHLIRLGRRRIVFFGDPKLPEIHLRYEGYRRALKDEAGVGAAQIVPTHLTADAAYESMRAYISGGKTFDAVFAATDVIAISAIRALTGAGLNVPADVAVVGFDDIALAAHTNPALTSVRQDIRRGAEIMVDLLLRRIAGEDTPSATMAAELVVRESCGAARH
jgi:DNA-binding LacI/PurR family transcriptional regulator